ncbi:MAG: flagellar hook-associated protein 2 [Limisphaerales bacterium]|jgi:flagellar hook-associated protein 2
MALELAGLASGFDWRSFIDQITSVERAPQFRLRGEQNDLARVNNAYGSLKTNLSVLKNRVDNLADPAFFNSRLTRTSDETVGSATATSSTPNGQFSFDVTQLASSSSYAGSSDVGSGIHTSSDLSEITVAGANFSTDVTAGFFTVNGKQITVGTTDSISDVFARISTETGSAVTGSYDSSTDKFTLTSASEIVLGSATDSSNFLQVSKLYNTGTGSVSSTGKLGAINQSDLLTNATTSTAISDGGAGAGSFKINGVSIAFNATTDSVAALLSRISDSDAGVTASYDAENDRFNLANKNTGDVGIALEDVTGNFLAVSGLTGGTLSRGNNALYTINGGPSLVSASNTITDASSGISGLSVTALKVGSVDLNIESDKAKLKAEIKSFIGDYNRVQAQIDRDTASTTSADGKVAAGILQGQSDAQDISSTLRSTINAVVSGLSASLNQVADIGIVSNGNDNSISLSDEPALDAALESNLSAIKQLFSDETDGLANKLQTYLEAQVGDEGSLVDRQDSLTEQSADIDEQIKTMERLVQANEQRLVDSFVSMEVAQANINQQLQFLSQRFGTSSSAAG